jgi:hypothetical protein
LQRELLPLLCPLFAAPPLPEAQPHKQQAGQHSQQQPTGSDPPLSTPQRHSQRHNVAMNPAKLIIVAALVAVIVSLGSALYHLSSTRGDSAKMLKALKLRIAISVGLFVLLFVAWWLGLIAPHGLNQ